MAEFVKPAYLALLLVIVVPGVAGGILAANRARNLCGVEHPLRRLPHLPPGHLLPQAAAGGGGEVLEVPLLQ